MYQVVQDKKLLQILNKVKEKKGNTTWIEIGSIENEKKKNMNFCFEKSTKPKHLILKL